MFWTPNDNWLAEEALRELLNDLQEIGSQVNARLGSVPSQIDRLCKLLLRFGPPLSKPNGDGIYEVELRSKDEAGIARTALARYLVKAQRDFEEKKAQTTDPALVQHAKDHVAKIAKHYNDRALGQDNFPIPHLADFLTLKAYYDEIGKEQSFEFDEKFGIHRSPASFIDDTAAALDECRIRRRQVAVAFIDIDSFKKVNTDHGHEAVDDFVLPPFMSLLESLVYSRGAVYRQGGDEYLMLLPNTDKAEAEAFLEKVRAEVESLTIDMGGKAGPKLTVSIGAAVAGDTSFATPKQLREWANKAAVQAKDRGKNRVVVTEH